MARGSQGRGSKQRSKGAAPKRKRPTPPGRAAAGAAPELSPRGRGRPKESVRQAPVFAEGKLAKALLTPEGQLRILAGLAQRGLERDLNRDQIAGNAEVRKVVETIVDIVAKQVGPDQVVDLLAKLTELHEALAGTKGSALRADKAVVPPFVEDEQRTDMATATPPPRGGEPYKS